MENKPSLSQICNLLKNYTNEGIAEWKKSGDSYLTKIETNKGNLFCLITKFQDGGTRLFLKEPSGKSKSFSNEEVLDEVYDFLLDKYEDPINKLEKSLAKL